MKKILALLMVLLIVLPFTYGCKEKNLLEYDLCNPNADEETVKLFNYMKSIYGKKTLSGINTTGKNREAHVVFRETGKEPAIRAYDMINATLSSSDATTDHAIQWHTESNGIVGFCWHWAMPMTSGSGSSAYTKDTAFRLRNALVEGTEENKKFLKDLDTVAKLLQKLRDNHTPVLWRPFHEASGGWFWWGADGAEMYKQAWNLMWEKFTYEYELTNLIWVWEAESYSWYVGDDRCDIVGRDWYWGEGKYEYLSGYELFEDVTLWSGNKKMAALTECDQIPSVENMYDKNEEEVAHWLFIAPWMNEMITTERWTQFSHLNRFYNSEMIVTLDQLPEWDDDLRHEIGRGVLD